MSEVRSTLPRSSAVDLSIVVVTHGAREMTLACLKSLAPEARKISSEVIIVDNASPDRFAAEIASFYPDFRLLPQVANLGFAAAANLAADTARGQYLLFLNPDTIVICDALVRLLEFARRNRHAGIWGVHTLFADGTINPTCCRRGPTLWRLFCTGFGLDTRFPRSSLLSGLGYPELPREAELPVDVICGVCLLVERVLWDRLGGFSPAFFMYGEDDDLCRRATNLAIMHHGSGTEPDREKKLCQIFAARSLIVRYHFAAPARHIGLALLLLRPFLGKSFAKRESRPFWRTVWGRRYRWMAGRFE
ncbi:MAG: glycosyltransferase family 2 protein [Verrucomicrobia bacterium]|nr:MAG: glycosyltransferase family 2 protein [Verrucomicrobiota bacterium]